MWRRNNDRFGCAPTARWVAALGSPKALAAMSEGDIEANRGDIFQAFERPKDVQRRLDPDSLNNYGQGGCRLRSTAMFHVAWIGLATRQPGRLFARIIHSTVDCVMPGSSSTLALCDR